MATFIAPCSGSTPTLVHGRAPLQRTPRSFFAFLAGGYVNSGKLNNAGSEGRYWSSTAYNSSQAYNLYFDSGNVNPSNNNNRYIGMSVRCLACSNPINLTML